ncbi:MAG: protein phosphatase 2C domain-containing protein [bacterium]
MRFEWGAASDTGRERTSNEDSYLAGPTVFAVADGMGGHRGGEVASDIAVTVLQELGSAPLSDAGMLGKAVEAAHQRILAMGHERADLAGMGTTLTGVAAVGAGPEQHWAVFNVGDSRVYRRLGDELAQLTIDHSEVQELVDAGVLSPAEARIDLRRNVITRSLGNEPTPAPDVWELTPQVGEQFIVCSDGLTGELSDDEIAGVLAAARAPQQAADRLVAAAVSAGGHDNVTVVVVETTATEA